MHIVPFFEMLVNNEIEFEFLHFMPLVSLNENKDGADPIGITETIRKIVAHIWLAEVRKKLRRYCLPCSMAVYSRRVERQ